MDIANHGVILPAHSVVIGLKLVVFHRADPAYDVRSKNRWNDLIRQHTPSTPDGLARQPLPLVTQRIKLGAGPAWSYSDPS